MIRPKVTIIVPVYNVEKYLTCCIGSILSQSFKDFELLLIDDGSSIYRGKYVMIMSKKMLGYVSFTKKMVV